MQSRCRQCGHPDPFICRRVLPKGGIGSCTQLHAVPVPPKSKYCEWALPGVQLYTNTGSPLAKHLKQEWLESCDDSFVYSIHLFFLVAGWHGQRGPVTVIPNILDHQILSIPFYCSFRTLQVQFTQKHPKIHESFFFFIWQLFLNLIQSPKNNCHFIPEFPALWREPHAFP